MKKYKIKQPLPHIGKDVFKVIEVSDDVVKQIRADVIDEFTKKLIQTVTSMTTGFRVVGNIERIAKQLKEQKCYKEG